MTRAEKEARRFEAGEMFEDGMSQAYVSRNLRVSRSTAARWYQMYLHSRLAATKTNGRPPLVKRNIVKFLYDSGNPNPQDWTTTTFRNAIKLNLGVKYDRDHVGRMLNKFRGITPKPRQAAV